jgi:hypothetical protein
VANHGGGRYCLTADLVGDPVGTQWQTMGVAATASPRTWLGIQLGHRFGDDTVHRNELIGDLAHDFSWSTGVREEPGRFEQDKKASGMVIGSVNGERIRSPR